MFAKEPMKYVMGSMIKIGYFKSNTELIYQDVIEGNLFEQVDKVMELIFTKYLSAFITYEGIQRVESFPISELAFSRMWNFFSSAKLVVPTFSVPLKSICSSK